MKSAAKRAVESVSAPVGNRGVQTASGARAEVAGEGEGETLRVLDPRGRLVFEYDPASGRTVVAIPEGDLELRTLRGSIKLDSAQSVMVNAAQKLDLSSEQSVRIGTRPAEGTPAAAVEMDARGMRLGAALLEAVAERAEMAAGEARVIAQSIHTTAQTVQQVVGVLETQAGRIVERARDLYTEVENVAQVRAGRMRTVVRETFQLFGKRALLRADKDMKIKGDKIYLA